MSRVLDLQNRWRAFTKDRAIAQQELDAKTAQNNAEIERLQAENIKMASDFTSEWAKKKNDLRDARDNAVMEEMASVESGGQGRSAKAILRELNSQNTVWIYDLRKRLAAAGRLPEQSDGQRNMDKPADEGTDAVQTVEFENIEWLSVPDLDMVGWSISEDFNLVRRERRGGTWFICGPENEFLKGDESFYKSTGTETIEKTADALMERLEPAEAS